MMFNKTPVTVVPLEEASKKECEWCDAPEQREGLCEFHYWGERTAYEK